MLFSVELYTDMGYSSTKLYVATLQTKHYIPFWALPSRCSWPYIARNSFLCVDQPLGYHRTKPMHPDKSAFPLLFSLHFIQKNCFNTFYTCLCLPSPCFCSSPCLRLLYSSFNVRIHASGLSFKPIGFLPHPQRSRHWLSN